MYTTPIQIRFNDTDQMGHINNAIIMEYFDLGKEDFFCSHGLTPEKGDFTVIIVHVEVDFLQQIHGHDNIAVTTCIEKIGNKSVHLIQEVINSDNGGVYARCRTILSGYSRITKTSAEVPDEVRRALTER